MDDDMMILPDDFESLPANESMTDTKKPVEDFESDTVEKPTSEPTEPVEAKQEPTTDPQKIKIKVDREEREITVEEAAALAQKGMNYERAIERARQEAAQQARDAVIADMGYTWNGKPIATESEYKQAMAEERLIEQYKDRDLPPEVIEELVESRRFREEQQREKQTKEQQDKQQAAYNEFFAYFEEVNERPFDSKKDTLPQEVQESVQNGGSLLAAYMRHHNKELRNQLKISKQNETNIKKAPVGSVTAGGGTRTEADDPFMDGFNSI